MRNNRERVQREKTRGGEQQQERFIAAEFVEGRITSFYDLSALLERRDLKVTPQHGPVFVFTAVSTTPLQPPLLWLQAVCLACACVSESVQYFLSFSLYSVSALTIS